MDCHRICDKYGFIPPVVEQPHYNMLYREKFEVEYGPLYDSFGMGTTIWSPLAQGVLTGKYNDGSIPEGSRFFENENQMLANFFNGLFGAEKREKTLETLNGLGAIAAEQECTQAQLCLAWAIKNKDVSTAIFGATRVA